MSDGRPKPVRRTSRARPEDVQCPSGGRPTQNLYKRATSTRNHRTQKYYFFFCLLRRIPVARRLWISLGANKQQKPKNTLFYFLQAESIESTFTQRASSLRRPQVGKLYSGLPLDPLYNKLVSGGH